MTTQIPTQNFTKGQDRKIIGVVLHISEGTVASTSSWFRSPQSNVSSHYMVGKYGQVYQFVDEFNIAWANGVVTKPSWKLLPAGVNPNNCTISIEHEGMSTDVWPDAQKQASSTLIRDICTRHQIPIDRDHIIGHYQIDLVNRPNCPAVDKGILDELVTLAKATVPVTTDQLKISLMQKLINLYQQVLAILKGRK